MLVDLLCDCWLAGNKISHDQMFSMPCDVFIPAAASNAITETVAKQLNCKFMVEAANGPTTPAGDAVLRDRGIMVCPDIYASGGGVAVSWMEWVQNLQNFRYQLNGLQKTVVLYWSHISIASMQMLQQRPAI